VGKMRIRTIHVQPEVAATTENLQHLMGLSHVDEIDLTDSAFDEKSVQELKRALPKCAIRR